MGFSGSELPHIERLEIVGRTPRKNDKKKGEREGKTCSVDAGGNG